MPFSMSDGPIKNDEPKKAPTVHQARTFIDNAPWREAVTYRDTWPHEYVVRDQVDDDMFEAVVKYVREHGVEEPFYHKRHIHWYDRGYSYWTMGAPIEETTILNRCPSEDTYQSRLASGRLQK